MKWQGAVEGNLCFIYNTGIYLYTLTQENSLYHHSNCHKVLDGNDGFPPCYDAASVLSKE